VGNGFKCFREIAIQKWKVWILRSDIRKDMFMRRASEKNAFSSPYLFIIGKRLIGDTVLGLVQHTDHLKKWGFCQLAAGGKPKDTSAVTVAHRLDFSLPLPSTSD